MTPEKDIRFTQKRVDESWKDQILKVQSTEIPAEELKQQKTPTSPAFLQFLSSLTMQALMHLGEIAHPSTGMPEKNLEAAKEMIDILVELQKKTDLRVSDEEKRFFASAIPELQMKFSQNV